MQPSYIESAAFPRSIICDQGLREILRVLCLQINYEAHGPCIGRSHAKSEAPKPNPKHDTVHPILRMCVYLGCVRGFSF